MVVGGGVVPLVPLVVVVVTGSVEVDVVVGTVRVAGELVEANTADVTTSARNTVLRTDRSGQFALLARGGVSRVAGQDPPVSASGCCFPSTVLPRMGFALSSNVTVLPIQLR